MFDWLTNLFKAKDPEAGVVAGQYKGIGDVQGAGEGTGEGGGFGGFGGKGGAGGGGMAGGGKNAKTGATGEENPVLITGAITSGFDQNWLGEQTSAGSAEGQYL